MRKGLNYLSICIVPLPVAAIVTILLVPFWRWFEATTQIESIGHSDPANWCFAGVYFLLLAASCGVWFRTRSKGRTSGKEKT